ncbi:MAG: hypothetical protein DMG88_19865 [Acidobacteria bacterium]|nr:MAG: hypothetical protein DMG88_19865 [Acidobacteriota bacterium]
MQKRYTLAGLASLALALAISLTAVAQTSTTSNPPPQAPAQSQAGSAGNTSQDRAQPQQEEDNPLNLTDEQKQKLRPIIANETQQMDAVRNDPSMTQEQKVTKVNQIRNEASPKIKAILTPEQLQKLADMQQKARQQQQDNKSAAPNDSQKPQP